jgi:hypothetical protein
MEKVWYVAKVISVESYRTAINVQYLTGEKIYNINRKNLRRFVQYTIDEKVQVDIDSSYVYEDAIIVGMNRPATAASSSLSSSLPVQQIGTSINLDHHNKRLQKVKVFIVPTETYHIVSPKAIRRISTIDEST